MINEKLPLILEMITSRRELHGRWLNTLSFLEYIGTRKILKSLPADILDETLLSHISEEAFHSLFFKRLARKITLKNYSFREEELLIPKESERYFQNLDKRSGEVSNANEMLSYFYTTWIVETRAVAVYSLYNRILKAKQFPFTLNPILKDEEKHLIQVKDSIEEMDPRHQSHFRELVEFEEEEFTRFLQYLEREVFQGKEEAIISYLR